MSHGLGLSICKIIAEKHNGSLTVYSTLGEGSTFDLKLTVKYYKETKADLKPADVLKKRGKIFKRRSPRKRLITKSMDSIYESNEESNSSSQSLKDEEFDAKIRDSYNLPIEPTENYSRTVSSIQDTQFSSIEKIVVAEDQLINLQIIKNQFTSLGLQQKTSFTINGQETIDLVKIIV